MLAKKFRLPIQEFVGKKGGAVKTRHFLLKIFPLSAYSRFGVIISSKVAKKATARNRLRRQMMEFFRTRQNKMPVADYLAIALPGAAELDKKELKMELSKLLIP